MKTATKPKKTFDAVAFMRKRRREISKEIEGMTPQQEIEYFKKGAAEFRKKMPDTKRKESKGKLTDRTTLG